MNSADTTPDTSATHVETAGAFDIRIFIGTLIGMFGVILTLVGLFGFNAAESAKTGGLNANLWAGLPMIAVAIFFIVWAKVAPIKILVQENEPGAEEPHDISPVS